MKTDLCFFTYLERELDSRRFFETFFPEFDLAGVEDASRVIDNFKVARSIWPFVVGVVKDLDLHIEG